MELPGERDAGCWDGTYSAGCASVVSKPEGQGNTWYLTFWKNKKQKNLEHLFFFCFRWRRLPVDSSNSSNSSRNRSRWEGPGGARVEGDAKATMTVRVSNEQKFWDKSWTIRFFASDCLRRSMVDFCSILNPATLKYPKSISLSFELISMSSFWCVQIFDPARRVFSSPHRRLKRSRHGRHAGIPFAASAAASHPGPQHLRRGTFPTRADSAQRAASPVR